MASLPDFSPNPDDEFETGFMQRHSVKGHFDRLEAAIAALKEVTGISDIMSKNVFGNMAADHCEALRRFVLGADAFKEGE